VEVIARHCDQLNCQRAVSAHMSITLIHLADWLVSTSWTSICLLSERTQHCYSKTVQPLGPNSSSRYKVPAPREIESESRPRSYVPLGSLGIISNIKPKTEIMQIIRISAAKQNNSSVVQILQMQSYIEMVYDENI